MSTRDLHDDADTADVDATATTDVDAGGHDSVGDDAMRGGVDETSAVEASADLERGMQMTFGELREALDDPGHPLHAAAEAASTHVGRSIAAKFGESAFGEQLGRIAANLGASLPTLPALRGPDLDFSWGLDLQVDQPVVIPARRSAVLDELVRSGQEAREDLVDVADDRGQLAQAALDAVERLSELVRVTSAHRDSAIEQAADAQQANQDASTKATQAMEVARNARTAAWVAAIVGALTLLATLAAVWATLAAS